MAQMAALVIEAPSNTVTRKQNQTLDVGINFTYVGPAQRITFTAVVTQDTWYSEFDEIGSTKKVVYSDIPGSDTAKSWIVTVSGLPLAGVEPKTTAYGLKVKAEGTFGTVEAGNKSCLYVQAPAGIGFKVYLQGYTYLMGDATQWAAQYYDPVTGAFVDSGWHLLNEAAAFSNVNSGGYLVVLLYNGATMTDWFYSTAFTAQNGDVWNFNLYLHGQPGDMYK